MSVPKIYKGGAWQALPITQGPKGDTGEVGDIHWADIVDPPDIPEETTVTQTVTTGEEIGKVNGTALYTPYAPEEVYIAIHGDTSYDDIKAAYDAGKKIVAQNNNNIYEMTYFNSTDRRFSFFRATASGVAYFTRSTVGWSNPATVNFVEGTKVTSIGDNPTDTQIPTAKAIKDYTATPFGEIANKQDILTDADKQAIADLKGNVKINGVETTDNNIPYGSSSKVGLVRASSWTGLAIDRSSGDIYFNPATSSNIDGRTGPFSPITIGNFDYAVKSALTNANGTTYNSTAQQAACARLGAEPKHGTLELIDTITVGSDTTYVSMSSQVSTGTPYNFKKVIVEVTSSAYNENQAFGLAINPIDETKYTDRNSVNRKTVSKLTSGRLLIMYFVDVENGYVDCSAIFSSSYENQTPNSMYTERAPYLVFAETINKISLSTYAENGIKAGTKIKIYGVKA